MAVLTELTRIDRWLMNILGGDATITGIVGSRIYSERIPQNVSLWPVILFTVISPGEDVRGTGATRILARPLYLVKAITQGSSYLTLQTLCDRIDTLLHGAKGGTADVTINSCVRERPFRMPEIAEPGNTEYRHQGGEYRIQACPLVNP